MAQPPPSVELFTKIKNSKLEKDNLFLISVLFYNAIISVINNSDTSPAANVK